MSKGFLMVDGDAVVTKTIETVTGDEMLRQTIELVISTHQGEWFYDQLEGIDRGVILCKNPQEDQIRATIEAAVLRVNDMLTVTDFRLELDAKRHANIEFKILKPNGEELEVAYTYGG